MNEQSVDMLGLYGNISTLQVASDRDWADELAERLRSLYRGTPAASGQLLPPLANLLEGIRSLNCQAVVLEQEYFDEDYLDVYRAFYCRSLTQYPRNCIRLHFFGCNVHRADLFHLTRQQREAYLGFAVIPPVPGFLTGRSIVRPWTDDGDAHFVTCKTDVPVNLCGNALTARGAPFIQQDTNVNVCAGAALWSMGHYMWNKYGHPRHEPARITEMATKYLTIGQHHRGLTAQQIAQAMREMGYSPLLFPNASPDKPECLSRIIHAYVESEFPVLALLNTPRGGHAVSVVGHDFPVSQQDSGPCGYNSDWIARFYVQDDAEGPYRSLHVKASERAYSIQQNVVGVLVPAPAGVSMEADLVAQYIEAVLRQANALMMLCTDDEEARLDEALLSRLVKRSYLRRSNQFKGDVGRLARSPSDPTPGMSDGFAALYRSMRMPKHVWVTELSTPELIRHRRASDRRILGEIVVDSTAGINTPLEDVLLAVHLSGRMIARVSHGPCPFRLYTDDSERPYPHLVRTP